MRDTASEHSAATTEQRQKHNTQWQAKLQPPRGTTHGEAATFKLPKQKKQKTEKEVKGYLRG